jgi:hypothetical protein
MSKSCHCVLYCSILHVDVVRRSVAVKERQDVLEYEKYACIDVWSIALVEVLVMTN